RSLCPPRFGGRREGVQARAKSRPIRRRRLARSSPGSLQAAAGLAWRRGSNAPPPVQSRILDGDVEGANVGALNLVCRNVQRRADAEREAVHLGQGFLGITTLEREVRRGHRLGAARSRQG